MPVTTEELNRKRMLLLSKGQGGSGGGSMPFGAEDAVLRKGEEGFANPANPVPIGNYNGAPNVPILLGQRTAPTTATSAPAPQSAAPAPVQPPPPQQQPMGGNDVDLMHDQAKLVVHRRGMLHRAYNGAFKAGDLDAMDRLKGEMVQTDREGADLARVLAPAAHVQTPEQVAANRAILNQQLHSQASSAANSLDASSAAATTPEALAGSAADFQRRKLGFRGGDPGLRDLIGGPEADRAAEAKVAGNASEALRLRSLPDIAGPYTPSAPDTAGLERAQTRTGDLMNRVKASRETTLKLGSLGAQEAIAGREADVAQQKLRGSGMDVAGLNAKAAFYKAQSEAKQAEVEGRQKGQLADLQGQAGPEVEETTTKLSDIIGRIGSGSDVLGSDRDIDVSSFENHERSLEKAISASPDPAAAARRVYDSLTANGMVTPNPPGFVERTLAGPKERANSARHRENVRRLLAFLQSKQASVTP